jgi:hypothetical protein
MGKRVRDKAKPKKAKVPPTPNAGLVSYNLWLLPQPSEKGSHDKWLEPIELKGRNRRTVAKEVRRDYQNRQWKLRLA